MFGKLLKNDLKAQWHSVSTIFLCVFVIGGIAELFVLFSKNSTVTILGGIVVSIAMLFACLVIVIAVAMLFAKTTFGRAGYLTLTLPVKTSSLIWSKTLSGLIWTYAIYILFFGSFLLWIYQVGELMGGNFQDLADQLFTLLLGKSIQTMISTAVYYLVWFAIAMFTVVQCLYLGITCSNVSPFSKIGIPGAVVVFFGSFAVIVAITSLITNALPFGMVVDDRIVTVTSNVSETRLSMGIRANGFIFSGPLAMLVLSALLNFPITYLTKNKVNIK